MKDFKFGKDNQYFYAGMEHELMSGKPRRTIEYYDKDVDPKTINVEVRGKEHPEYLIRIVYSLESMPEWLKRIDSQLFKSESEQR